MAKKNAPAALQTEVINDDEWAKILERKGLVGEINCYPINKSIN